MLLFKKCNNYYIIRRIIVSLFTKVSENISNRIGMSLEDIKDKDPIEFRAFLEKKSNKKIIFTSEFPFIGRGNVLRDRTITTEKINKQIDLILG